MDIVYHPIGVVRSPLEDRSEAPRQPHFGRGIEGIVEVHPDLEPALADLDGFSHVVLVCHLDRSEGYELRVTPPGRTRSRGLFATRSPRRPNPIGLSVVRLDRVEGRRLHIRDLDLLDGTPVLDIKPHVPTVDDPGAIRTGWLEDDPTGPTGDAT